MGIDAQQLTELIIRPALKLVNMFSESAENLVLGTGLVESKLSYVQQIKGPALGLFQMEPSTHDDLWYSYLYLRPSISIPIPLYYHRKDSKMMVYDLRYAAIMCRVKYLSVDEKLPEPNDLEGLAQYWKDFYNTWVGKGKKEDFIKAWEGNSYAKAKIKG